MHENVQIFDPDRKLHLGLRKLRAKKIHTYCSLYIDVYFVLHYN